MAQNAFELPAISVVRISGPQLNNEKGDNMTPPIIELCVNPSDETIHLGPLAVRFLLTGEDSAGTIAVFQVVVPGGTTSHSGDQIRHRALHPLQGGSGRTGHHVLP